MTDAEPAGRTRSPLGALTEAVALQGDQDMQTSLRAAKARTIPPPPAADAASYWRRRADESLEIAYELKDAAAISKMLEIGRRYERLARQAEARWDAAGGPLG